MASSSIREHLAYSVDKTFVTFFLTLVAVFHAHKEHNLSTGPAKLNAQVNNYRINVTSSKSGCTCKITRSRKTCR